MASPDVPRAGHLENPYAGAGDSSVGSTLYTSAPAHFAELVAVCVDAAAHAADGTRQLLQGSHGLLCVAPASLDTTRTLQPVAARCDVVALAALETAGLNEPRAFAGSGLEWQSTEDACVR
jgi:hypothetical protein